MTKWIIPSKVEGRVRAPASKSMMQRAIAAALLADGETVLHNPTFCQDAQAALGVAEQLGAAVQRSDDRVVIQGGFLPRQRELDCGESGLAVRMFTSIAALHEAALTLTGSGSLLKRPMDLVQQPLQDLGAEVHTQNGFVPITVKGPLRGGRARVDGSLSSQFVTGMLMALPRAKGNSQLVVENLKSRPYIDLTLRVLADFGVSVENHDYKLFFIEAGQRYRARQYTIEGDWSGAAFLLVAAALAGGVELFGLDPQSCQADRAILEALALAGARVEIEDDAVVVTGQRLKTFEFDASHCPDLFPPLVALAAHCPGESVIKGAGRLKHKESNRAAVLQQEFGNLGIEIELSGDWLIVRGGAVRAGTVDSHNDHRIAMAAAAAAAAAGGEVKITGCRAVAKSYPDFFKDIAKIGVKCHE
jgi:3-phosphoshikimate 1-carboxyvinyltransferase